MNRQHPVLDVSPTTRTRSQRGGCFSLSNRAAVDVGLIENIIDRQRFRFRHAHRDQHGHAMMKHPQLSLVLLLALLASCATTGLEETATPVIGTPADIQHFVGTWIGSIIEADLAEPIEFRVAARPEDQGGGLFLTRTGRVVPFLYVRVAGNTFAGAASPHFEDACGCVAYSTVRGEIVGHTITGEMQRLENSGRIVRATFTATRVGAGEPGAPTTTTHPFSLGR